MPARRQFLKQIAGASSAAALVGTSQLSFAEQFKHDQKIAAERTLRLYNIHTGESLQATFWADGQFVDDEVQQIDLLMRDHRANQAMAMQRRLYEKLYHLQTMFGSKEPLYVVSAYRAPKTNADLRRHSGGVAEGSMHMQGKAIDIRIPGVSHRHLHKAAVAMRSGGVGYYPKSGFIHIDTGRRRHWQG
ncbi:MAG: DUF882 domain-containing protein [Saccharospirillaceae bacterium]|jgi:uncharacterized protein YcbK (DUF882 family)|nr:hypothetical protein A3759_03370 [Thalassolituus sp. HI0120]MCH2042013.1 DUF882 domain-containing protein [Saccharospirillaceae bacterium]